MNGNEFKTASSLYLHTLPSMKKAELTITAYTKVLKQFEKFCENEEEITPLTIVEWREYLHDRISNNSIVNYMKILRAFFTWAVRKSFIEENPVQNEDIPEMTRIDYDLLTLDEIKQLLTTIPHGINKKNTCRNRAIVILLIQTGLRNTELRSLTPQDLDFEHATIRVRHGKGDKERFVAFPQLARECVTEYMNSIRPKNLTDVDWLFGTDCDKKGLSTHGKLWKQISEQNLLTMIRVYTEHATGHKGGVKVHALRHAYASLCDELGVSLRDVQNSLGHASLATTERIYVTVLNKKKAAANVNSAFDGVLI